MISKKIAVLAIVFLTISFSTVSASFNDEDRAEFARHRAELFKRAGDEVIIISGNGGRSVDKYYYYLTGSTSTSGCLILDGRDDSTVLFVQTGRTTKVEELSNNFGIKDVRNIKGCKAYISGLVKKVDSVMIRYPGRNRGVDYPWSPSINADRFFKDWLAGIKPSLKFKNVKTILEDMRRVKTPWEIEKMEESCRIAGEAHIAAMKATEPGVWEYQLAAEAKKAFTWNAAFADGFPCMASSGPNSSIVHYSKNDRQTQAGDLLLMDYGCDYEQYVSDISRTWPVGGKFSEKHRKAYQDVLDVQKQVIKAVKPGQTLIGLNVLTNKLLREKGYGKHIRHGVTHYLGMLVHDVGGRAKPFEPGVIVTVEPGIYYEKEGWGIRIEDDILVTEDGNRNLTKDVPKEIVDIEALASTYLKNK